MAIDPGTAAIASAGIKVLGGLFGRKKSKTPDYVHEQGAANASIANLQNTDYGRWVNKGGMSRAISIAANDARNAGLHPLFALGGAIGAGSGAPSVPGAWSEGGQHSSGSAMGTAVEGIADGLTAYAKATAKKEVDPRLAKQVELLQSQIDLNRANHDLVLSKTQTEIQKANVTRPPYDPMTGIQVLPPEDNTVPGIDKRPTVLHPKEDHVNKVTARGERGEDFYKYAPPALGGDEINQIIWAVNRLEELFRESNQALGSAAARLLPHGRGNRKSKARSKGERSLRELRRIGSHGR